MRLAAAAGVQSVSAAHSVTDKVCLASVLKQDAAAAAVSESLVTAQEKLVTQFECTVPLAAAAERESVFPDTSAEAAEAQSECPALSDTTGAYLSGCAVTQPAVDTAQSVSAVTVTGQRQSQSVSACTSLGVDDSEKASDGKRPAVFQGEAVQLCMQAEALDRRLEALQLPDAA